MRHRTLVAVSFFFFFQAEDGIRDLVRSRGLGDVYKRQYLLCILQQKQLFLLEKAKQKGVTLDPEFGKDVDIESCLSLIHI